MEKAKLTIGEKIVEIDIVIGTENDRAIDISALRRDAGVITLDNGYQNTGSCKSAITYVNGEKGILRYRGYKAAELAMKSTPLEVAHLLMYGELPTCEQLNIFKERIADYSYLHKDMVKFFDIVPPTAHPMAILSSAVNSLAMYFPSFYVEDNTSDTFNIMA